MLTVFGFGRHEYAMSVSLIYLLYAVALIVVATMRRRRYLDAIAGAFVIAACFQGIAFGWLQGTYWVNACYWSLVASAVLLIMAVAIRKALGVEPFDAPKPLERWYRGIAALAVSVALLWLIIGESGTEISGSLLLGFKELLLLTAIWVSIAWLEKKATDWTIAQLIATAAGMLWIHHFAKQQSWYTESQAGFLHPFSIQMHIAWFALFASASTTAIGLAMRWTRQTESKDPESKDPRQSLVVRQAQELGLEVVDLVKDPNAAGPLTRSTTVISNLDQALVMELNH